MSLPAFAELLERLVFTPGRLAKLALIRRWFDEQPDPERGVGEKDDLDRLERLGDEFHARVREGFLALAARDPERYLVLHARDSEDDIAAAVRARVAGLLAGDPEPQEVSRRGLLAALFDPDAEMSEASETLRP